MWSNSVVCASRIAQRSVAGEEKQTRSMGSAMSAREDESPEGALDAPQELFRELDNPIASEKDKNVKLQRELDTAKNKGMAEKAADLAPLPLVMSVALILPHVVGMREGVETIPVHWIVLASFLSNVLLLPKLMMLVMGLLLKLAGGGHQTTPKYKRDLTEGEALVDPSPDGADLPRCRGWWAGDKLDDVKVDDMFKVQQDEKGNLGQGQYGRRFL